jgi:hypothetical protein
MVTSGYWKTLLNFDDLPDATVGFPLAKGFSGAILKLITCKNFWFQH